VSLTIATDTVCQHLLGAHAVLQTLLRKKLKTIGKARFALYF